MTTLGETAEMHNQTVHVEQPETDGSAGRAKVASRVGSGDDDRSGESPDFSPHVHVALVDRMRRALPGAIFVWDDHRLARAEKLAQELWRMDLKFVSPLQVGGGCLRGKIAPQVTVHPGARLTELQQNEVKAARAAFARWQPKPPPNYSPIYAAALYPELALLAREHGYALAVHGSLRRDLDLIAVPWVEQPSTSRELVSAILEEFAIQQKGEPDTVWHGRERWMLSVGFGECAIDLQFVPTQTTGDSA